MELGSFLSASPPLKLRGWLLSISYYDYVFYAGLRGSPGFLDPRESPPTQHRSVVWITWGELRVCASYAIVPVLLWSRSPAYSPDSPEGVRRFFSFPLYLVHPLSFQPLSPLIYWGREKKSIVDRQPLSRSRWNNDTPRNFRYRRSFEIKLIYEYYYADILFRMAFWMTNGLPHNDGPIVTYNRAYSWLRWSISQKNSEGSFQKCYDCFGFFNFPDIHCSGDKTML